MRALFAAAVVLAAQGAMPAAAQDRMTQENCTQSWTATEGLLGLPAADPGITVDEAGWCALADAALNWETGQDLRLRSLRWRASDVARFVNDGLPPRTLEIEAAGIAILPQTGDAVLDYVFGVQSLGSPLGLRLSARWDGVQNSVIIDTAEVTFDAENRIAVTARIDGVNLTDRAMMQASADTAGLSELTVRSTFAGWFEEVALMPLAAGLLRADGTPPEGQVEALKLQAVALLDKMPADVLPSPSRDALAAFVQTLPTPRGSAQLQINARPAFGAERALPFAAAQGLPEAEALEGLSVLFTWAPKEPAK